LTRSADFWFAAPPSRRAAPADRFWFARPTGTFWFADAPERSAVAELQPSTLVVPLPTSTAADSASTAYGVAMRYGTWTEIRSPVEGHFLERFAPGSFSRSLREDAGRIKSIFQHGRDPRVGFRPLGPISFDDGPDALRFTVALLDIEYVRELVPAIKAGLMGASVAFRTLRDRVVRHPDKSSHNPHGLPEVTVIEARLREVSLTPFPQYKDATVAARELELVTLGGRDGC
jgi:HK97 family phage prohead protease